MAFAEAQQLKLDKIKRMIGGMSRRDEQVWPSSSCSIEQSQVCDRRHLNNVI
jgi:hypothetical protein